MLLKDAAGPVAPELERTIEQQIIQRTCGRIHRLRVEGVEGRGLVHGCTHSYYLKQLALLAVLDVLDGTPVELDVQVIKAGAPRATQGHDGREART